MLDENRQIASALVGPHGDIGFVHKLEQLLEEKSRGVTCSSCTGENR